MPGIFSRIVTGEIPSYKIAENELCFAFLDINPLKKGHVLVIPKLEVDYIFDLDETTYTELLLFANKIAKAIKAAIDCKRVGVAVIGMEVPHAHIHLIPIHNESDMNFNNVKLKLSSEEMTEICHQIQRKLN